MKWRVCYETREGITVLAFVEGDSLSKALKASGVDKEAAGSVRYIRASNNA